MDIKRTENGFKVTENIDINAEMNKMLNFTDEINRKIITDKNECVIQALLNRINQAINYMEQFKYDMETGGINVDYILKILKGQ